MVISCGDAKIYFSAFWSDDKLNEPEKEISSIELAWAEGSILNLLGNVIEETHILRFSS